MQVYPIYSRIKGYKEVVRMLYSLRKYSKSEVAQKRLKIIKFYEQYGGTEGKIKSNERGIWRR